MVSVWKTLIILSWKSIILRQRSYFITALELIIPLLIFYMFYKVLHVTTGIETYDSRKNPPRYDYNYMSGDSMCKRENCVYSPRNNVTDQLFMDTEDNNTIGIGLRITATPKHTEEEVEDWLTTYVQEHQHRLGFVFTDIDETNYIFQYKIRKIWNSTTDIESYYTSGISRCQILVERGLLKSVGVQDIHNIYFKPFQSNAMQKKENDYSNFRTLTFFYLIVAYMFLVISVVRDVVDEKESGIKELMKVMGMSSWMIWAHWFIYAMLVQLPVLVIISIIVNLTFGYGYLLIILIIFLIFTINFLCMLFLITCLFSRTTRAITIVIIGWFVINLALMRYVIHISETISYPLQILLALLPHVNLCWSLYALLSFRLNGVKWTFEHLFTTEFSGSEISVGLSLVIFILSTVIFVIITFYLDAVFPGPHGVAKPFTFVCQWVKYRFSSKEPIIEENEIVYDSPENFEPAEKNAKVGIMLRGLNKTYTGSNKVVAVKNVELNIYKGEIMALLGHNGAGKTTTMSMITGMTAPTRGVISFEGKDITVKKGVFRESLGLCPQHDVYFSKLTVLEHLVFFGVLKGMSYYESKEEGRRLLWSLNLLQKESTLGSKLSGGMKRRLCLAVSLTGNPKVLILDEPTSGLDPQNRRLLWDNILRSRGERTVLITTHLMEEAEVLGDRIAIMDHGVVVCCGTSIFLKKRYGSGYQVHVLKQSKASVQPIARVVEQNVPQYEVKAISNNQVDFIITEEYVNKLPGLFTALENQRSSLDITGITMTCSSMEDVFLKVATNCNNDKSVDSSTDSRHLSQALFWDESEKLEGFKLFYQRLHALFLKRIMYRKRRILSLIIKVACIALILGFISYKSKLGQPKIEDPKALLMDLNLYPNTMVLIYCDSLNKVYCSIVEEIFKLQGGHLEIFTEHSDLSSYLEQEMLEDNYYNFVKKILFKLEFVGNNMYFQHHEDRNRHVPSIVINLLSNVMLRNHTGGKGLIQMVNHPLVYSSTCSWKQKEEFFPEGASIVLTLFFGFGFIILLSDFIRFTTEERVTGFKHQQFMAGVSPLLYWFVNLTFDLCLYSLIVTIYLILFFIFGPKLSFLNTTWFSLLILVVLLQGLSGLSFGYLYSYVFNHLGKSLVIYFVLTIILGLYPVLLLGTIAALLYLKKFSIFLLLNYIFNLNPIFSTGMCFKMITKAIIMEEKCRVCDFKECPVNISSVLKMPTEENYNGMLLSLYYLVFTSVIYFVILIIIDYEIFRKIIFKCTNTTPRFSYNQNTDDDVKREIQLVKASTEVDEETPLRVEGLEKKYLFGPKAVKQVSFLVEEGQCFGLLGVNGAGKSTVFKMLTGEILPDRGDACVNGFSVKSDRRKYISSVGYCPQTDAILPTIPGKDILATIAKLRGIPSKKVKRFVDLWLTAMGILEHGKKPSGTYSGGTKRKLNTAMALIGGPKVVFLDEPTTGVDPVSRRKIWTVVKELQKHGQAVVLTSHSMEECEVLCSRLTIVAAGRMICIGSVEYLKSKYGKGFIVILKLTNSTLENVNALKRDFNQIFPTNSIKDEHAILIHYEIMDPNIALSQLFSHLLNIKIRHVIVEDFTVTNMTLEDLFLSFAESDY